LSKTRAEGKEKLCHPEKTKGLCGSQTPLAGKEKKIKKTDGASGGGEVLGKRGGPEMSNLIGNTKKGS